MANQFYQLFETGQLQATQGAMTLSMAFGPYLRRHVAGDWGKVGLELRASNERALNEGEGAIASAYDTTGGRLLVITDTDRGETLLLIENELADIN